MAEKRRNEFKRTLTHKRVVERERERERETYTLRITTKNTQIHFVRQEVQCDVDIIELLEGAARLFRVATHFFARQNLKQLDQHILTPHHTTPHHTTPHHATPRQIQHVSISVIVAQLTLAWQV
jgi:hypothetical protein